MSEELSSKTIEELCLELISLKVKMRAMNETVKTINDEFVHSTDVLATGAGLDYNLITEKAKALEDAYPEYKDLAQDINRHILEIQARTKLEGQEFDFLVNSIKVRSVLDNLN